MAKEKITARARTQYTDYMVKEPMELMEFLAAKMPDAPHQAEIIAEQTHYICGQRYHYTIQFSPETGYESTNQP